MRRFCFPLVTLGLLAALGVTPSCSAPSEEPGETPMDPEALGRWNVTATQGDRTFPLWFELKGNEGGLEGLFQPRGGHAIPMEGLAGTTSELTWSVLGNPYRGSFQDGRWSGTVDLRDANFSWTAERAPALPSTSDPRWGEPVTLFNGVDLSGWTARDSSTPNLWKAEQDALVNAGSGSDLLTEASFQDFRLHIEVNCPEGSNSGIYLRGRYEIQVQDDFGKEAHNRNMGGLYGRITPTENAARPAGEWQVFDVTLLGRYVTVELNGKTIIENQEIAGITGGALNSREAEPGPILLQGDHGAVSYRNIVLTARAP